MRPATTTDGRDYYQYILVHTDDLLVIAEKTREILNLLDQHYMLKPVSIGEPKQYLGSEVGLYYLPNNPDRPVWYMSSEKYFKEAIRNLKTWLDERGRMLKGNSPAMKTKGITFSNKFEY
jgi:hypothetical protein